MQWFLIYAAGALICAMSAAKASQGWQAPALVGLAALVWGVWIMTHMHASFAWGQITDKNEGGHSGDRGIASARAVPARGLDGLMTRAAAGSNVRGAERGRVDPQGGLWLSEGMSTPGPIGQLSP